MRHVVFAHGLEGRPDGYKARFLREAGFEVSAPDGRGQLLAARIRGLRAEVGAWPGAVLVGSSYGGLAAAVVAEELADGLAGLVLLAPALIVREPPVERPEALLIPASLPTVVFHGLRDDVIPFSASEALVARCPHVCLFALDDVHDLRGSMVEITRAVRTLAERPAVGGERTRG